MAFVGEAGADGDRDWQGEPFNGEQVFFCVAFEDDEVGWPQHDRGVAAYPPVGDERGPEVTTRERRGLIPSLGGDALRVLTLDRGGERDGEPFLAVPAAVPLEELVATGVGHVHAAFSSGW